MESFGGGDYYDHHQMIVTVMLVMVMIEMAMRMFTLMMITQEQEQGESVHKGERRGEWWSNSGKHFSFAGLT